MKLREHDLLTRILRTRPILAACICYAIGCVLAYLLYPSMVLIVTSIVLFLAASLFFKRFRSVFLMLCILCVGTANFSWQWQRNGPIPACKDAVLSGTVSDTPYYNETSQRLIILIKDVCVNGTNYSGKLRLYLRDDDDPEAVAANIPQIGNVLSCTAHIWEASEATNPGQFNFSNYLRINDIRGYATAKIGETQYTGTKVSIGNIPAQVRAWLGERIDRLFPTRSDIARAFLIGDRTQISEDDKTAFSASGIMHLLAISGMHISLLSYALMFLLNRFLSRRISFSITFVMLILYGILIGFPASLFRALFMFAAAGIGTVIGRYNDPITSLALSMLIYLIIKPLQILGTGFELSYGATAGILLLGEPFNALFHTQKIRTRRASDSKIQELVFFILRWLTEMFIVTLSAQIAILPIVIYAYGSQSVLSFIVGIPSIPIAMLGYLIAIPAALLGIPFLGKISDTLFFLLAKVANAASQLPVASFHVARFPVIIALLCVVMCLAASGLSKLTLRIRKFIPLFIIPAILISDLAAYLPSLGTSVMFMDAGQADCAVIRTGGKVYFVDTGDSYSPAADYLSAMNYKVEGIFLTHPHSDHTGGLEDILEICTPKRIYISANWYNFTADESVTEALEACRNAGSEIITVSAGDSISLSDDTSVNVLFPNAGFETDSANEDSLLLRLTYGEASVLFCGDSSAETIESYVQDADILKVPHHGAASALSQTMLENVSPSACVISVGYNTYGHPTEETLSLVELSGSRRYRTDECGAVSCRLHTDGSIDITVFKNGGQNEAR